MTSKRSKNAKNSKKRKQALDVPEGQRRNKHLTFLKDRMKANKIYLHKCYQNLQKFLKIRIQIVKSPFVLVTPFDVDRERSLIKSVSFTPANREKSSTNHENSLVRTAHTETSVSTTLTPSVTLISYERTSRTPTLILSPMQIDLDKEIDYYNVNDDDNEEYNDNRDKSDNREPLPKPHIVEAHL
ncbi:unnamed protein product [Rhizophagus irregularis]|uniref:Uncharacterized protein n=1 Tax=Rhizophagus irregularis TaxID=588596 RepID=A0A916EKK5_9GLOM|nr:unnamed protein product [Rhizophagus irregularis]CAB5390486.1 unnamed protein product [Rhizophagus irregularis]